MTSGSVPLARARASSAIARWPGDTSSTDDQASAPGAQVDLHDHTVGRVGRLDPPQDGGGRATTLAAVSAEQPSATTAACPWRTASPIALGASFAIRPSWSERTPWPWSARSSSARSGARSAIGAQPAGRGDRAPRPACAPLARRAVTSGAAPAPAAAAASRRASVAAPCRSRFTGSSARRSSSSTAPLLEPAQLARVRDAGAGQLRLDLAPAPRVLGLPVGGRAGQRQRRPRDAGPQLVDRPPQRRLQLRQRPAMPSGAGARRRRQGPRAPAAAASSSAAASPTRSGQPTIAAPSVGAVQRLRLLEPAGDAAASALAQLVAHVLQLLLLLAHPAEILLQRRERAVVLLDRGQQLALGRGHLLPRLPHHAGDELAQHLGPVGQGLQLALAEDPHVDAPAHGQAGLLAVAEKQRTAAVAAAPDLVLVAAVVDGEHAGLALARKLCRRLPAASLSTGWPASST